MAKATSGRGRVTVFSMLHDWPGHYCVLAYTTAGHFGDTAVLGVIPISGNTFEPGDLFAMAGRHQPTSLYGQPPEHARAAWLACTGFSARLTPKPDTVDFADAAWSLDMTQQVTMAKPMYGHEHVAAGRLQLEDPELMEQARAVFQGHLVGA
ncbi:hypothetical protein ACIOC2_01650 [Streptomyces sp. NPDC088337]|uniref:hypothetical protein n=1 Tax=unclassified Streptomyces TaxID=2593676 RepID=UPI0038176CCF